jgi:hypothetical protein
MEPWLSKGTAQNISKGEPEIERFRKVPEHKLKYQRAQQLLHNYKLRRNKERMANNKRKAMR